MEVQLPPPPHHENIEILKLARKPHKWSMYCRVCLLNFEAKRVAGPLFRFMDPLELRLFLNDLDADYQTFATYMSKCCRLGTLEFGKKLQRSRCSLDQRSPYSEVHRSGTLTKRQSRVSFQLAVNLETRKCWKWQILNVGKLAKWKLQTFFCLKRGGGGSFGNASSPPRYRAEAKAPRFAAEK